MANLYDKAGLVNIPVGYQDGFLYNIKPTDNTLAFRFNRDSAATRVNKEGLIEQVGYFGPELVTNGDFSTDSDWTLGNGWSISGGKAILVDGLDPTYQIYQLISGLNTKNLKVTFDVTDFSGDAELRYPFRENITGNGSYTFYGVGTLDRVQFQVKSGFTASFSIDNVSVTEVIGDKPRIDYTDSLTSPSFLLEPQSTNLIPYSEDFSQSSWVKQSSGVGSPPVVTSNYSTSPSGTLSADRVVFNINGGTTSSDFSQLAESVTSSIGDLTNSIFIKSNTASNYNMSLVDPIGGTPTSIVVTSEWQRFNITSTLTTTTSILKLRLRGNEATSDFADVSVWGAQIEQLSYPTSYIPTVGSIATRAQETCNSAGSASTFNSTEGVLYADIAALADNLTFRGIALSDGTTNNRVLLRYRTNSNQINLFIKANGTTIVNSTKALTDITNFSKFAIKYKSGDIALWIDGVEAKTNTNTFTLIGLDRLNFDAGNGSDDFYGKTKGIYVFNEALTDDELQQLTT